MSDRPTADALVPDDDAEQRHAMKTRAMTVAHAEPVTPSAGNPSARRSGSS